MNTTTALCFEGGALWGIAYLGALSELFKRIKRDNIQYYCGTSVGSIIAFALALGLTTQQIDDAFWKFRRYLLIRLPFIALKIPWNLVMNFGIAHSDVVRQGTLIFLREAYPNMNDITFREIPKGLIIPFTILNNSFYIVSSKQSTPNMSVIDAVSYSCCGNIIFTPNYVKLVKENRNLTIVDGGVSTMNYPISVFTNRTDPKYIMDLLDNNQTNAFYAQYGGSWEDIYRVIQNEDDGEIIGLRFGNPDRLYQTPINDLISFLWAISTVTYQSLFSGNGAENRNSIWIDTGNTFSLDITNIILPNRIHRLKDAGKQAVLTSKIFPDGSFLDE